MCRKLSICALAKIGTSIIDVVEAPQVHPFVYTEWDLRDFPHAKLPTNLAGPAWWAVGDSEMTATSQCTRPFLVHNPKKLTPNFVEGFCT